MRRLRNGTMFPKRTFIVLVALVIAGLLTPLLTPVHSTGVAQTMVGSVRAAYAEEGPDADGSSAGLQILLSEGAEQPQPVSEIPLAPAQPLSAEEVQPILDRLPPLVVEESDTTDFRLPEQSLPPPRPGETVEEVFPPEEDTGGPAEVEAGPLEVLRYAPEGAIQVAPFLNVTFNQPMVPLTALEDLSALDVPVKLTPDLPGTWRWIGTKTLTFEYASEEIDRFPMATEYQAEVPAGTQSAMGNELEEAVSWTFTTPPPQLTYSWPSYGPQRRDPLLFAAFNQRIDPQAVLETIQVTAGGSVYPVRLVTEDELEEDATLQRLVRQSGEDRWLAFRADKEFPADTTVVVNIGPGTPSAEGPLVTEAIQAFSFQTYAPLRIDRYECAYGGQQCPPLTPFNIIFNNPIDAETFDESQITVVPEIPGLVIQNFGYTLSLAGVTKGRTTYKVTVDGAIQDIFGQTLGQDEVLTFRTGSAQRTLVGPGDNFITLDPSAETPVFTVYSINYERLRVRAYAVEPADWPAYLEYLRRRYDDDSPEPPGRRVLSEIFQVDSEPDTLVETAIELDDALEGETGQLIVIVDFPPNPLFGRRDRDRYSMVQAWVQITQIGLDAFVDHSEMVAWTTYLRTGETMADVEVELIGANTRAVTDDEGVAVLELSDKPASVVVARQAGDTAMLPQNYYYWYEDGWTRQSTSDHVRWYVFDDRAMYRPGEEVHVKGWVRRIGGRQDADVSLLTGATAIRYQVVDPQGNQLHDGMLDVNDLGGFDLAFNLPENANLGYANLYLNVQGVSGVYGTDYNHGFQIQEFRRPEFEVTAQVESEGPYLVGGAAVVAVNASYFAGGPLPNAETNWTVQATPGSYSPPNWPDFIFGKWIPWWFYNEEMDGGSTQQSYSGTTDASGSHYLRMDFTEAGDPQPYSVSAESVVMDVNRQAWASQTSLLVHPAELYVGLRSQRTFVEAGDPLDIDAIVTDLDGTAVEDRQIQMRAARLEWKYQDRRWQQQEAEVQECMIGSQTEPVTCTFSTEIGGEYRITAAIQDQQGRANESEFTRWVSGGSRPAARNVEQEEVTLIPNQETYKPGDTAEILVQAPFTPAQGLLTLSRNGIVSTERFEMDEPTYVLEVPLVDEYIPNLHVSVDLAGAAQRTDDNGEVIEGLPKRPAYASGSLNLAIPPVSRTLDLNLALAATELEPGATTTLDLAVTDAQGAAVEDAEVAVVVVDEAILALTNYNLADPIATFYRIFGSGVSSYYSRASIVLADPAALAAQVADAADNAVFERAAAMPTMTAAMPAPDMGMAPEAAMEAEEGGMPAGEADTAGADGGIAIRTDFNPLATWAPSVRTDSAGRATVEVKLPDNLTRYRVMAVVVADHKYFGSAEANLTARLPLMVRPAAPRFLNFGDRFELPIVVQNQTEEVLSVDIAVRGGNVELLAEPGQRVEIPANDRREVRFPMATASAGTTRFQIAAVAGAYADAAAVELPVFTPATTEAFATYGVVDEGAIAQPVAAPTNVFPQFGGLEVGTSSTALHTLTDAYLYLVAYRFECSEQLASRILAVAALRDVLAAFEAEGLPDPETVEAAVARDIERLEQMQNFDGGFPIWTRGKESIPYYSIHVTHALYRARSKGYTVSDSTLQRAVEHLRNIEDYYPYWYSQRTRQALSAYALYVRDLIGDVDTLKARNLLAESSLEDHSLETIAWIWQVLADDPASTAEVMAIRRHVNNRAVETPGAANFVTSYDEDAYMLLHSNRRTDALLLDALINDTPESDLIPKVVTGLMAHRTQGRWNNTQENVFILLALDRYYQTFESVTPDFVARIWLGETYVGAHEYAGRTTERHLTTVPMEYLVDPELGGGQTQDLVIDKEGPGRLYYRLGMRYAPDDLQLDPLDMGFVVQRTYEAVDDPDDVTRDEDGTWRIKAGARVRVRIGMVADSRRYHVALVDPLPAGLEIVNPALAVSESVPQDPNDNQPSGWWWWRAWYQHQNLRDERAEAFTTLLWDGVYNYSYVARATTPGEFVAPPAKAEEMYSPEVFGRSASDKVIIE